MYTSIPFCYWQKNIVLIEKSAMFLFYSIQSGWSASFLGSNKGNKDSYGLSTGG